MNKRLTAKRLLKRHNRHASGGNNWADGSKVNMKTLDRIVSTKQSRRHPEKSSLKAGT